VSEGIPLVGVVVVSDSVVVGRMFSAVVPIDTIGKSTIQHQGKSLRNKSTVFRKK